MSASPNATIRDLIADLDSDDTNQAQEAQAALGPYGRAVLEPLLDTAPNFGRFGQLCAIELFQEIGDPQAGTVLIPMLDSENGTVRDWAAQALGELGVPQAVPALRRAYAAVKERGTPLDWTEPLAIRTALTELGARREVVPPRVAELERQEGKLDRCWAVRDLPEVITELANARQLVLDFMWWEGWRDTHTLRETPRYDLDWSLPWEHLVESARVAALNAARTPGIPDDSVATLAWMDEADR
jgi:HEAT repeat protein